MSWIIENTIVALLLAGVAFFVARYCRSRPAVVHVLWLLVVVKLVCPPIYQWPLPVAAPAFLELSLAEAPTVHSGLNRTPPADLAPKGQARWIDMVRDTPLPARQPEAQPAAFTRMPIVPATRSELAVWLESPWTWLGLAWGIGVLAMLIPTLLGMLSVGRLLRRSPMAPPWLRAEVETLAGRLGVKPPDLRIVSGIETAFVWSIGRPVIAWPARCLDRSASHRLRTVLAHELAHLRRRDHWVARFEVIAAVLLWWHPLFWFARARMRLQAELACDAWAVWAVPAGRTAYAGALIDAIERDPSTVDALPALGVWSGAGRAFEERLTMILHAEVPRRLSGWATAALATLSITLFSGVSFAQSKSEQSRNRATELEQRIEKRVKELLERHGYRNQDPEKQKPTKKSKKSKARSLNSGFEELDRQELQQMLRAIERRLAETAEDKPAKNKRAKSKSKQKAKLRKSRGTAGFTIDLSGLEGLKGLKDLEGLTDGGLGELIASQLQAGLAEAKREIRADEDLREMGMTEDIIDLVEGLLGSSNGNKAFVSGLQGLLGKAVKHGLNEARIELEAEGIDNPEFLGDLGEIIESALHGGEVDSAKIQRSLGGFVSGMVHMGLKEARLELQNEGIDPEFLGDLGKLIEVSIQGGDTSGLEKRLEHSLGEMISSAIEMGLKEAAGAGDEELAEVLGSVDEIVREALSHLGDRSRKSKIDEDRLEKLVEKLIEKAEKVEKKQTKRRIR